MKPKAIAIITLITLFALIVTASAAYNGSMTMRQNQMNMNGNHEGEGHHGMENMDIEEMHRDMEQMMNTTHKQNQTRHGCH